MQHRKREGGDGGQPVARGSADITTKTSKYRGKKDRGEIEGKIMDGKPRENHRRILELRKKMRRMEEEMEDLKSEWERKEKEWKAREIQQQVTARKEKRKVEERLRKLEERMVREGKSNGSGNESEGSDWGGSLEEFWSGNSSDSEEERGRKRLKSQVRTASPSHSRRRESRRRSWGRERGRNDVIERHRSKVLMFRKGKKWEEDTGLTEWLQMEIGEDLEVVVEPTKDRKVFKIWCEGKDARGRILEVRDKWEEEEIGTVDEWRPMSERKARIRAIEEMKRVARKAGYKDAKILIKEDGWKEKGEDGGELVEEDKTE